MEKENVKDLMNLSANIAREEENLSFIKNLLKNCQKKYENYQTDLRAIQAYFETYASDESLVEKFSSIKENLDRFKEQEKIN